MYYRMDWRVDSDTEGQELVAMDETPDTGVPWTMGIRCTKPVAEPIEWTLDPRSGTVMPDWIGASPVFSQRFVDVLKSAGVRNMDLYATVVVDREQGKTYTNYKSINFLGRVSCADLKKSEYMPGFEPPLMKFQRLVLDESRTMGLPLFRLAEDTRFILVSEKVKQAIESAHLLGVRVLSLEDPAAY